MANQVSPELQSIDLAEKNVTNLLRKRVDPFYAATLIIRVQMCSAIVLFWAWVIIGRLSILYGKYTIRNVSINLKVKKSALESTLMLEVSTTDYLIKFFFQFHFVQICFPFNLKPTKEALV